MNGIKVLLSFTGRAFPPLWAPYPHDVANANSRFFCNSTLENSWQHCVPLPAPEGVNRMTIVICLLTYEIQNSRNPGLLRSPCFTENEVDSEKASP